MGWKVTNIYAIMMALAAFIYGDGGDGAGGTSGWSRCAKALCDEMKVIWQNARNPLKALQVKTVRLDILLK